MKKLLLSLLLGMCIAPFAFSASNIALEDTSLVRISTPEARANFLSRMMKDRLDLDTEEYAAIQAINIKYEELLQEMTLAVTPSLAGPKKKKSETPFDKLSEARDKEIKKALSGRHYREYNKQRWGMKNALKKQMLADKEEQDRRERQLQIEQEKARADSIAAAKVTGKKTSKKKAPSKKKKK
ncbi:MAG: hypothetical protein LBF67_06710 [Prevotellaceae bacterium]|nr:hypothetical protein [Prevotellaceae bacterium]